MNSNSQNEIITGLTTAYIDGSVASDLAYRPLFVSNNYREGKKVLTSLEDELLRCDSFQISVAFITMGGITPLLQTLKALEKKGVRGQILTTNYLNFSEPKALERLHTLKNITLKMYDTEETGEGFHTKGYIFKKEEIYRIIIGSSNMTSAALTSNKEWNTKLVSTENGEVTKEILAEFHALWESQAALEFNDFYDKYKTKYEIVKRQQQIAREHSPVSIEQYRLEPNSMQIGFIENLKKILQEGENRTLLISATGTGKTYASAFAMRNEKPKKALFIVHRELIAKQALKSYRKVFGKSVKLALLSGNSKEYDADILFATMTMMAKPETLAHYQKDEFSWICIDEVHRAGSESYQRIMNYFQPEFWLGMTASPERTDGFDIFDLFHHNIAYEIRLQHALKEDLLCPFHYFGITDIEVDGEVMDDNTGLRNFSRLVSDVRVNYVLGQANYYGYSGDRVKGLVFCSCKDEARELSLQFSKRGYYTAFLSGEASESQREQCIELLTRPVSDEQMEAHAEQIRNYEPANESSPPFLDYIFTIDIFNEGVDIPEINQVLMLRPTQSPIIFVQQLGRGLRKAEGKEYVVIIDFIGNYTNNYMIPIALSGDRSYNKDTIRRYVSEGTRIIPGASTIHFDEISKKRIFQSIDSAKTNDIRLLKEAFEQLKYRLGRIPSVLDFKTYGTIDVNKFFAKFGSYYAFLVKYYGKEYEIRLNSQEEIIIEFLSRKVSNMKRIHELALLNQLVNHDLLIFTYYERLMQEMYHKEVSLRTEESVIRNLTNAFPK